MAERTPLYMDINDVYSGDELGMPNRDAWAEGVLATNALKVSQAGTPGLSVNIAAGAAWVLGDTDTTFQPCYRVINDAVVNKGISPDPSLARKVLVVAQITDQAFSGSGRKWDIVAIHGTPNASPVLPATPASALPLASIAVAGGATSIVDANITDLRYSAAPRIPRLGASTIPPANPQDGDTWLYPVSEGILWNFRYNAGSSSAFKWEFLGGSPDYAVVETGESTLSTTYTDLPTVGPSITVARAGIYMLTIGATVEPNASASGATAALFQNAVQTVYNVQGFTANGGNTVFGPAARTLRTTIAAGDVMKLRYVSGSASVNATFFQRFITLTPVRIS